jgi:hypothetical protein
MPSTAAMAIEPQVTRRICSSFGGSTPAASAASSLRSSTSQAPARTMRLVARSSTAGWTNGSISVRPALPIDAAAAATARSSPTSSAVVTRSCARSAIRPASPAAMVACPKSPSAGDPSGRTTSPSADRLPSAIRRVWSLPTTAQRRCRSASSTWPASREERRWRTRRPGRLAPATLEGRTGLDAVVPGDGRRVPQRPAAWMASPTGRLSDAPRRSGPVRALARGRHLGLNAGLGCLIGLAVTPLSRAGGRLAVPEQPLGRFCRRREHRTSSRWGDPNGERPEYMEGATVPISSIQKGYP